MMAMCIQHERQVHWEWQENLREVRFYSITRLKLEEMKQVLCSNVMHIDSNKFLFGVRMSLQLTVQCRIERESQTELGFVLQAQLNLCSRGYIPVVVHTDPQSAFKALAHDTKR